MVFLTAPTTVSLAQFIVSIPLILIFFFGIGFILNMILKTTWLPIGLYAIFVLYFAFQLSSPHFADIAWMVAGLLGAIGSGFTIKMLRAKGYRMF